MKYASLLDEELVKECAESQDTDAWEEFVHRYRKIIAGAVWRTLRDLNEANYSVVDDLVQDTFFKVLIDNCRLLRIFRFEHPKAFEGMLRKIAGNLTRDYVRNLRASKRDPGGPVLDLSEVEWFVSDGHAPVAGRIERDLLLEKIDRILEENTSATAARDRDIFWLVNRQGFTAAEVARIKHFNLDVKGVESVLHRLKCLIRRALAEQAKGTDSDAGTPKGNPPPAGPEGNPPPNTLDQGEGQP